MANNLLRRGPWPTFGYQEYVDILRAAWRLNRALAPDAPRFRVIALDSQWSQHALWFGEQDPVQTFRRLMDREKHMKKVLKDESLAKGEKALVHIGYGHTLTGHGARLGKVLTDEFGTRVRQVVLHHRWPRQDGSAPLSELLERLFIAAGGGKSMGLDVLDSPLGDVKDDQAGVFRFVPHGTLSDIAQSYVFLKPLDQLRDVRWIPGFIVEENYEHARAIAITNAGTVVDHEQNGAQPPNAHQSCARVRSSRAGH